MGRPIYSGADATLPLVASDQRITNSPWDMFVQSRKYKQSKGQKYKSNTCKYTDHQIKNTPWDMFIQSRKCWIHF